jgi:hypothetical protein
MTVQYNRLGLITSVTINSAYDSQVGFDISGLVTSPAAFDVLKHLMRNGLPELQQEWRCLYCTSPQPITRTHCKQCGAPRSFIVG